MKKILFSLMAATLCLMMTSCGDPTSTIKSLTEDIENNGDEWTDESQWDDSMVSFANACIDFANSDPDEDAYDDFIDACAEYYSAMYDISDKKAKKARDKAESKFDKNHKDLKKDLDKARRKLEKIKKDFD